MKKNFDSGSSYFKIMSTESFSSYQFLNILSREKVVDGDCAVKGSSEF